MTHPCIALLGRKDEPTDALEEYCLYLSTALQAQNVQLQLHRVRWEVNGWDAALKSLAKQAIQWRDTWVLIQYTALAWSVRGFPQKVLRVLKILKSADARVGIVFHDVEPYQGTRLIDSIRHSSQVYTMRRALALADLAVFTVPPDRLSWLNVAPPNAMFAPVGANLPIPDVFTPPVRPDQIPTIGVFGITGGEPGIRETQIILTAVRHAAEEIGGLRLSIFGRHAELRESEIRQGLRDLQVELSVEGVLEPAEVIRRLSVCDVLLFVRGHISSRRGSAIAGIACGLPVIAYPGSETAAPITDSGVVLVSPDQPNDLHAALLEVLVNANYRMDLATRSRVTYKAHFSWSAIASRVCVYLNAR